MFTTTFPIRVALFAALVAVGALNWGAEGVSSQPEAQGAIESYFVPHSTSDRTPLSPTSPGRVDDYWVFRYPAVLDYRIPVEDKIAFTQDKSAGLAIAVSGAEVHDMWTWLFYSPGSPPEGGVPYAQCWGQIRGPGETGNPYDEVAVVTNCGTLFPWLLKAYPLQDACPCHFTWWVGPKIAGRPAESEIGTWTAIVDYTDPEGVPTPAVAQDEIYLMHTPAVVLIHGYMADCDGMEPLERLIEEELAVTDDRVVCYDVEGGGYDSRKGVEPAARKLAGFVRDELRPSLGMGPDEEVDLVAHSMGGLVARYYRQLRWGSPDGPIGSISMLGTPNEGVWLSKLERYMCAPAIPVPLLAGLCFLIDWAELEDDLTGFDPDSDGIDDMKPGSEVLHELNDGFVLPDSPQYRAHAGLNASWLGAIVSLSQDNDCVVSLESVNGPGTGGGAVFSPVLLQYPSLTHGGPLPGCGPPTLTDSESVAADLAVTIKGDPTGGESAGAPAAPAQPEGPGAGVAMAATVVDFVLPSESKTHQISVPSGLDSAAFVVFWRDSEAEPDLGFTLTRPGGGPVVSPTDLDVIEEIAVTGDPIFHVLMRGFVMSAPQAADDWEVTVEALSVPEEGQAYLVALMADSEVSLSADTADPVLAQGEPQVIMATLYDGTTAVEASSISAQVTTPAGIQGDLILHDDGVGGDEVAGDLTYSATFASTADCGVYGVLVTATGDDTSEGTVTRQQMGSFEAHVPGDAVRDPCNPDDDEDLLTDADEFDIYLTDPLDRDTDDDLLTDGDEVIVHGTDPLDPDTDDDLLTDGDEVLVHGTDPLDPDTDDDLLTDGDEVIVHGTDPLDPDTDDDLLTDGDEVLVHGTDPLDPDTDDDGCADSEEVALGSVFDPTAAGWYDVFDVPKPANADPTPNGVRNSLVDIGDVLAVLFYAYAEEGGPPNSNGVAYDSDKDSDTVPDGRDYDRTPGLGPDPVTGIDPAGPPNGIVDMGDVIAVLAQANLVDCSGPP